MTNSKKAKVLIFCLIFVLLILTFAFSVALEHQYCMDVLITDPHEILSLKEDVTLPINHLYFSGEQVAADTKTATIYISQSPDRICHYTMLEGALTTTDPSYQLFFLNNTALTNSAYSVERNEPLTLILRKGNAYKKVNVVLTTLPVISINGQLTDMYDGRRQISSGFFTLWCGKDPSTESYTVQSCSLQWHLRGNSSSFSDKKPWKLSLKDSQNNNLSMDILGMGSDDDWILNPMNQDDTKIREKVCMDFWNRYLYPNHATYPMSTATYAEVILNGEYAGLYLIQRRVDEKYLALDRQKDLLFKGSTTYQDLGIRGNYRNKFSPFDEETTYALLEQTLSNTSDFRINLDSFMTTVLFNRCFALIDNYSYKNIYYILQAENKGYSLHFVPWDTDMAMGITWLDTFTYDYENTISRSAGRMEYSTMLAQYPQLDVLLSERWHQLRNVAFSEDNIFSLFEENIVLLQSSGVLKRDEEKWGLQYGGQDSYDNMYRWCAERLIFLDKYHTK